MNPLAFDRLLYTDCVPGQGTAGTAGFQVQARSAGCDAGQSDMAVSSLLFSAQRVSPRDYPEGLAHTVGAGWGTAQSRYVGKAANDAREGNHLADCILTRDLEAYGVIRPAQLWQAAFWRSTPWPTTTCPELENVDLGPLDTDAIADWLREDSPRAASLKTLLTVLEDPRGQAVFLRANDVLAAVRWIAAATMLLPQVDALSVSFLVFSNSLDNSQARVTAAPTPLHPRLVPGSRPSQFVLDAQTGDCDLVPVSRRAEFWVEQLLAASEPFDVLEAVELESVLDHGRRQTQDDVRIVALAVIDQGSPVVDATTLTNWLGTASLRERAEYGAPLVQRLLATESIGIDDLRALDAICADGIEGVEPGSVRARLLKAEIDRVHSGLLESTVILPPLNLSLEQRIEAARAVQVAAVDVDDRTFERLLGLATAHDLELASDSDQFNRRLDAFIANWIATPERRYDPQSWPVNKMRLLDCLHQHLNAALRNGNLWPVKSILPLVYLLLREYSWDRHDQLYWHAEAYYTSTLDDQPKQARVMQVVSELSRPEEPGESLWYYQSALSEWRALDGRSAMALVGLLPPTAQLNTKLLVMVKSALARSSLDRLVIKCAYVLVRRGELADMPVLAKLAQAGAGIEQVLDILRKTPDALSGTNGSALTAIIAGVDTKLTLLYAKPIARVMAESPTADLGLLISRVLAPEMARAVANRIQPMLEGQPGDRIAAYALIWESDGAVPEPNSEAFIAALARHISALQPEDANRQIAAVDAMMPTDEYRAAWNTVVQRTTGRNRRLGSLFRGRRGEST